jgi:hypothetical protein
MKTEQVKKHMPWHEWWERRRTLHSSLIMKLSFRYVENNRIITTGAQTLGTWTTKFYMIAPHLCTSSVRNLLRVTFLAPRFLRCVLYFRKICRLMIIALYILIFYILKRWENKQQWTKEHVYLILFDYRKFNIVHAIPQ